MARKRNRVGKRSSGAAVSLRDLSNSLVAEIEGAVTFGNVRRLSALATTLRVILPLAAKLPGADVSGDICAVCKEPLRISEADLQLIENFIERQKEAAAGSTLETGNPATDSAIAGSFPGRDCPSPPPQGGGENLTS